MILLLSAATLINICLAFAGCLKITHSFGRKESTVLSDSQSIDLWNRYRSPVSANSLIGFAGKSLLSDNKNVGTFTGPFQVRELEVGWPIRFVRGAGIYPDMLQGKDQIQLYGAVILDSIDYQLIPYNVLWFRFILNIAIHSLGIAIVSTIIRRTPRRLRKEYKFCPQCDYDLRGNRDSGCSECGWKRDEVKA
ncbi:MAG: hypothetical protein IH984_11185 [Planctomycetes bacterium]|nr:hypothetical protein [Planctomycetota bacterium]